MQEHEDDVKSPRRRRRKKKKKRNLFDIPGVRKIIMTELTQKIIECVVGEHVTSETPWKYVKKELVQDNLELHEESSEFLPLRREILAYPRNEILIGYIADETHDKDDEFYICVTEEATDAVQKIIERLKQEQEERLYSQLYKEIHPCHHYTCLYQQGVRLFVECLFKTKIREQSFLYMQSMGTEEEVDESIEKNHRPLIEVEVETQYPIFPGKVQFRLVRAENKRDGYMELKCPPEENFASVYRRRIDSGIQVAPALVSTEAQTVCTYPKNAATQYLYEAGETEALYSHCEPEIVKYANEYSEDLSDLLRVNGVINLYANDFDSLVKNEAFTNTIERSMSAKELIEYLSFMDVNLCKGKMISDIYWHRMWSGTLAISYSEVSPNIFYTAQNKDDEVYKAVHNVNIILIWSFLDALRPKLILETPREVHRLTFCKFDENILIGGCKNGQIVVWDIRNKLQKVEEKEVLTTAQQRYRTYMHSLMGWMKNTHDIALVRPAAVSDLRHSHKASVTGISWVDPHYEFSRTGNLTEIEPDEEGAIKHSMQFVTSSLDGTILIWDLKDKPVIQAGGYKPKKLRRLKKRPSALEVDVSPYRALHLNFKPRYRINISRKDNKNKPVAITRSSTGFTRLTYVEAFPNQNRKFDIKDRVIYKPVMTKNQEIKPEIKIGTAEGDFAAIRWEGQDFDSGEIVNCEQGKYIYDAKYHDGPVNSIQICYTNNTTLTVGGKIFALWRDDFPGRPILWRRSRHFYTKGELNIFQSSRIVVHSVSGVLARWVVSNNSKTPVFTQVMSNSFLTASALHPFLREKLVYGIGDEQGAFRLFYLQMFSSTDNSMKAMQIFIDREVNRKKLFLKWQDDFNKRNESYLLRMKEEAEQRAKEEAAREAKRDEHKTPEKPVRKGPQPGKYIEWIVEQRQITEEARIKAMIISKKQLDTKELEKRRKPLQKLDEENERKKRKQKERLKQGETIFHDTVASLFPDVMKEKPPPPPDPYAGGDPLDEKDRCYRQYERLMSEMDSFITTHPLQYDFSFKNLLVASRNKDDDYFHSHIHTKRFDSEKKLRRGEEIVTSDRGQGEEEDVGGADEENAVDIEHELGEDMEDAEL